MKKLIIIALILSVAFAVGAVEWRTANQTTIGWDAVTLLDDGSALPAGTTIQYRVYMSNSITDPTKANPVTLTTTDQLEYTITLNAEGKFYVGVSAVRFDGTEEVDESAINWSDVNGEMTPDPFGLRFYKPLPAPKNLR